MPDVPGTNAKTLEPTGFVAFVAAGEPAVGEFHCSQCGYGVIVQRTLPRCPMCSGTSWEQAGMGVLRRRTTGWPR
jgi:rubrerythrin